MALDTDAKRLAAIHLGSPWRALLPLPVAALGEEDRAQLIFLSRDLTYGAAPDPDPPATGRVQRSDFFRSSAP